MKGLKLKLISTLVIMLIILSNVINNKIYAYSDELNVYFFSIGYANCTLIEQNNHYGLIDSGDPTNDFFDSFVKNSNNSVIVKHKTISNNGSYNKKISALSKSYNLTSRIKEIVGSNQLDFVIATHSHSDHIGQMGNIANSSLVGSNTKYYYKPYIETSKDKNSDQKYWYNELYYVVGTTQMKNKGATLIDVTKIANTSFNLGSAKIQIYNTGIGTYNDANENDNSIVSLITYNNKKVLITADISRDRLDQISSKIGKIDVLTAPHHGDPGSTSKTALNNLNAKYYVLQTDLTEMNENNSFKPQLYYLKAHNMINNYYLTDSSSGYVKLNIGKDINFSQTNTRVPRPTLNSLTLTNGWKRLGKDYIYVENEKPVKGWKYLKLNSNSYWYYFDNDYIMATGFRNITYNNKVETFYLSETNDNYIGTMVTGLNKINNKIYYFDSNGVMLKNANKVINNTNYYFNSQGIGTITTNSSNTSNTTNTKATTSNNTNTLSSITKTASTNTTNAKFATINITYNYSQDNSSCTVNIKSTNNLKSLSGFTLSSDCKTLSKTYTQNTTQNITITDIYNYMYSRTINVNNIKKQTKANITISKSFYNNSTKCIVTIKSDKKLKSLNGWTLNYSQTQLSKEYTTNGSYGFTIYDIDNIPYYKSFTITGINSGANKTSTSNTIIKQSNSNPKISYTKLFNNIILVNIDSNKKLSTKYNSCWTITNNGYSMYEKVDIRKIPSLKYGTTICYDDGTKTFINIDLSNYK